jgi:hypothetical protein
MSKSIKNTDTVYKKARIEASNFNDKLSSREGASELLGVSTSSLLNYETGVCKQIPPDVVVKMAEIYNTGELMNYYCCNECPIGEHSVQKIEIMDVRGLTLNIVSCLKNSGPIENNLIEIFKDGVVSEDEKPKLQETVNNLDEISKYAQSLKVQVMKYLK